MCKVYEILGMLIVSQFLIIVLFMIPDKVEKLKYDEHTSTHTNPEEISDDK